MDHLTLEIHPLRPAVRRDIPITLDVLMRISPPAPVAVPDRPPLNLALVLDRSGSMSGAGKIGYARQAACFAVEQLLPEDRVSVTLFDEQVELLVPSTKAEQRGRILDQLRRVEPRGSTDLHAGWLSGANQVREFRTQGGLNRVLLLTDGLANAGETNPEAITAHVKTFAAQGVTTTAMGVGADYNENLLEAMAKAGDGNYYYIESPVMLQDLFQTELHGLMATTGRHVLLELLPQPGVEVVDVLNDLERDAQGRLLLPNLVLGLPVEVVLRLQVQPQTTASVANLCAFRVHWLDPRGGEHSREASLALPGVTESGWGELEPNPQVVEQSALQMAGRLKRQATHFMDQGDSASALEALSLSRSSFEDVQPSAVVLQELEDIEALSKSVSEGELNLSSKRAKYQHYNRQNSKPRQ